MTQIWNQDKALNFVVRMKCFSSVTALAGCIILLSGAILRAQDHTLLFDVGGTGVSRGITNWGLDTCWNNVDNMRRGIIFMGSNNVNIVRVPFVMDAPLTNNDISSAQKAFLQSAANTAALAGSNARWDMNIASSVDPWYQRGANLVYPDRWAAAVLACQRYYNRSIFMVEGFNEPDYLVNGEGSAQDLYDIFGYLQASTNFPGTLMAGGSVLNNDLATAWYNPLASRASVGTTHSLAGSASTYVGFMQTVVASNDVPYNPELHNMMEAIMGVEYGLQGGIWWGSAELARGELVKACQGKRLGYAEDLAKWTAAAVYRGTNGTVQAFVGASERMATTTTYRYFSKDRDVFYDGNGPQREYTVRIPGGTGYATADQRNAEKVVNITWGADPPPPINGRYVIVNRNSGKVLEVPGASMSNGTQLDQTTYTGALNQQWDVNPLTNTFGGDFSYFTIKAAHSGVTMDLNGFSYANGAAIQQWNGGTNTVEQWYLQYTTNGYFKIRSKWSNKVAGVNGASTASGAVILQWDDNGTLDHEWRFIPTNAAVEFVAPAAPTGVSAIANAVSIRLNWSTNGDADLAGYAVLRSTNSGGPYEIVARGLTNTTFTDKSANLPRAYFYVVKAVDRSLNSSVNSAQVSATPASGPAVIARYAFDGNMSDGSTNANHPIVTNGSPTFVAGKYGSAMDLDGTNHYAMLPANMLVGVTNFTIALWVNWDGGNPWQRIFDFGNGATENMFLTPSSGSGTLRFAITTNGGGAEQQLNAPVLPVGQWRHVAITLNGNAALLYTNGVLAASNTMTISPASFNPALNYLGESQYEADPLFNGRLDDLYVFNYALSTNEIFTLANHFTPPTSGGLSATPGNGQVALGWGTVSGAASYNVKRSVTNGGPYTTITNVAASAYTDIAVTNGITYYYVVSAVNIYSEGSDSTQATATPTSTAPVSLSMALANDTLLFSWPADHTGWRLQSQTNLISSGLSTNWFDMAGSAATNTVTLPADTGNGSVFFRLIYP